MQRKSKVTKKVAKKKKVATKKVETKKKVATKKKKAVLLSGGNPQIAKGDGDAPVQAYLDAMPGWKQTIGKKLDAIIVKNVAGVKKAVKWNTPFYSVDGKSFFLGFHCYDKYIKVTFFSGTSLQPPPPSASKVPNVRYLDVRENDLDEAQFATWVRQASLLPGWTP